MAANVNLPAASLRLPDVTIRHLLKFLSVQDVARLRQVDRQWNCLASLELKSKIGLVWAVLDRHSDGTTRWMLENSNFIWTNVLLHSADLALPVVMKFFERFGAQVRSAKLTYYEGNEIKSEQLSKFLSTMLPNLKELELEGLPWSLGQGALFPDREMAKLVLRKNVLSNTQEVANQTTYYGRFLRSLGMGKATQNLESFTLSRQVRSGNSSYKWSDLMILNHYLPIYGEIKNLVELNLGCDLSNRMMIFLLDKFTVSPLKVFTAPSVEEDLDQKRLDDFLVVHKDTLEILRLNFVYFKLSTFPNMKNLTELTLSTARTTKMFRMNGEVIPPCIFKWGSQFPNLVTLNLIDNGTEYADGFGFVQALFDHEDTTPCLKVKNLTVPAELTEWDFERIGVLFPNVLKVTVPVQTQVGVYHKLWTNWPQLRTLVLSSHYFDSDNNCRYYSEDENGGGDSSDSGDSIVEENPEGRSFDSLLTGIPDESLRLIQKAGKKGKPDPTNEEIEAMRIYPSIIQVKELNHLMIYDGCLSRFAQERSKITKLTLQLAVTKLRALNSLLVPVHVADFHPDDVESLVDLVKNAHMNDYFSSSHFIRYDWQQKKYANDGVILQESIPDYQ